MFAFRLALALGRHDVDGLLADLTLPQLAEWMAYAQIEPWGEDRADLRAGVVASMLHNLFTSKGRRLKPADFLLAPDPKRQRAGAATSSEAMKQMLAQFTADTGIGKFTEAPRDAR